MSLPEPPPVPRRARVPVDSPADDDGVDVSLIRWMLSLSPAERLAVLQIHANALARFRAAAAGS